MEEKHWKEIHQNISNDFYCLMRSWMIFNFFPLKFSKFSIFYMYHNIYNSRQIIKFPYPIKYRVFFVNPTKSNLLLLRGIQDRAKVGLQLWVWETPFILVLLFINYCIIFHTNNCKPTFAPPYIWMYIFILISSDT